MCQGLSRADIAAEWVVNENTVKCHLRHAYRKLDVHNAREVVALVDSARDEAVSIAAGRVPGS